IGHGAAWLHIAALIDKHLPLFTIQRVLYEVLKVMRAIMKGHPGALNMLHFTHVHCNRRLQVVWRWHPKRTIIVVISKICFEITAVLRRRFERLSIKYILEGVGVFT